MSKRFKLKDFEKYATAHDNETLAEYLQVSPDEGEEAYEEELPDVDEEVEREMQAHAIREMEMNKHAQVFRDIELAASNSELASLLVRYAFTGDAGDGKEPNLSARTKRAILLEWFHSHIEHPYPEEHEKQTPRA